MDSLQLWPLEDDRHKQSLQFCKKEHTSQPSAPLPDDEFAVHRSQPRRPCPGAGLENSKSAYGVRAQRGPENRDHFVVKNIDRRK